MIGGQESLGTNTGTSVRSHVPVMVRALSAVIFARSRVLCLYVCVCVCLYFYIGSSSPFVITMYLHYFNGVCVYDARLVYVDLSRWVSCSPPDGILLTANDI